MKKWIGIMLGLFGLDQLSKFLIASNYFESESRVIISQVLNFTYVRNGGLVWGLEQGATEKYVLPLALLAAAAMGIFIYLFIKNDFTDKRTKWYLLALSFLMAGTLGNGIDRLIQSDHRVIDFIDVELFNGFLDNLLAVFNLADLYLNVGLVLLFIDIFFLEKKRMAPHE